MSIKRSLQVMIRNLHRSFAPSHMPKKVGLYFHSLEKDQHTAFRDCIHFWTDQGYRPVNAEDFVQQQDQKLLFVSFDDNYKSWHSALPLLDALDLKVTFFINTLPIRGEAEERTIIDYFQRIDHHGEQITLSVEEIRELFSAGHTIGCHSHSHFDLGAISSDLAKEEIITCKQRLEEIIDHEVTDFSYPFGMRRNFTEELRDFCMHNGFRTVCNASPGLLHGKQRRHSINRTAWDLDQPIAYNEDSFRIDGRVFERLTGKSAIG